MIHEACERLDHNKNLFQGHILRPRILDTEDDDVMMAWPHIDWFMFRDEEEHEVRAPFVFYSNKKEMKLFFSKVRDKRDIRVSVGLE